MTDYRIIDRDQLWQAITDKYEQCIDTALSRSLSPEPLDRESALTHMAGAAFLDELRMSVMADTKHTPGIPAGYKFHWDRGWVPEEDEDASGQADPSP